MNDIIVAYSGGTCLQSLDHRHTHGAHYFRIFFAEDIFGRAEVDTKRMRGLVNESSKITNLREGTGRGDG